MRITPALEEKIGAAWQAMAMKEGHRGKVPNFRPGWNSGDLGKVSVDTLRLAAREGGAPSGKPLGEMTGQIPSSVASTIAQLVVRHLIIKRNHPDGGLTIHATWQGREYLADLERAKQ